jgi:hypothetical protein
MRGVYFRGRPSDAAVRCAPRAANDRHGSRRSSPFRSWSSATSLRGSGGGGGPGPMAANAVSRIFAQRQAVRPMRAAYQRRRDGSKDKTRPPEKKRGRGASGPRVSAEERAELDVEAAGGGIRLAGRRARANDETGVGTGDGARRCASPSLVTANERWSRGSTDGGGRDRRRERGARRRRLVRQKNDQAREQRARQPGERLGARVHPPD